MRQSATFRNFAHSIRNTNNITTMHIAEKYSPQQIEAKWYDYWTEHRLFHSEPDEREPYTIVIPPPNVTGMLHMGHMLNNTLCWCAARA